MRDSNWQMRCYQHWLLNVVMQVDTKTDACIKAEEAVAQLSRALLVAKQENSAKESEFERMYLVLKQKVCNSQLH